MMPCSSSAMSAYRLKGSFQAEPCRLIAPSRCVMIHFGPLCMKAVLASGDLQWLAAGQLICNPDGHNNVLLIHLRIQPLLLFKQSRLLHEIGPCRDGDCSSGAGLNTCLCCC